MAFAHANAPETQAGFTQAGTYVLRLSVTDSDLTVIDEMTVVVTGSPGHKTGHVPGRVRSSAGGSGLRRRPDRHA